MVSGNDSCLVMFRLACWRWLFVSVWTIKLSIFLVVLLCIVPFLSSRALSQKDDVSSSTLVSKKPTLVEATMCEGIKEYNPRNQAIVFSMTIGEVSCFTSFDPVPQKTVIYHNWLHRDKLLAAFGFEKLIKVPGVWKSPTRKAISFMF
jgi:hypothetical protein